MSHAVSQVTAFRDRVNKGVNSHEALSMTIHCAKQTARLAFSVPKVVTW
jgi:hypothetical protein